MANTLLTSTLVTKEAGYELTNKFKFLSQIDRQYDSSFGSQGRFGKVGDTIFIRTPVRLETKSGQGLQLQNLLELSVPLTIDEQFQVAFGWSSAEDALDIEEVRSRYIDIATTSMANAADVYAINKVFLDVANAVGTPGTAPSTLLTYMTAVTQLVNSAVDDSNLVAMLSPVSMATIAAANSTLFHPGSAISEQYRTGMMTNDSVGIARWYREPNIKSYTTGSFTASTPLIKGASQTGSTLITDGWASSAATLRKGDTFTIGGVFKVNAQSYVNTSQLQNFVVTADTTSVGVDMATLPISPSIIVTGPLRNVSNSPADDAVITVKGATSAAGGTMAATSSPQNLIFNKKAFTFATVDMLKPAGNVDCQFFRSKPAGVSMRFLSGYDMINDQNPSRLDMLGGAATVWADAAARAYA